MEMNEIQKKGVILLAIGVIMIAMIFFVKMKNNIINKSNTNNSSAQFENVQIDPNADYIKLINTYMTAIQQKNAEKIISTLPSFEEKNEKSVTESINTLYTKYESKCGKNIKMSYNIEKIQKLDNSSVENVENSIKQNYKTFNNIIDTIYKVKIKIKQNISTGYFFQWRYFFIYLSFIVLYSFSMPAISVFIVYSRISFPNASDDSRTG